MITHILKLIQKRFESSLWILSELLIVFMILWFMTDYFLMQAIQVSRPVGFNVEQVYRVMISHQPANSPSLVAYPEGSQEPRENYLRIVSLLERHPDVAAVSVSNYSLPYNHSNSTRSIRRDSVRLSGRLFTVSPGYFEVFGICPAAGGKPEALSERLDKEGMISAGLAETLFGRTDVVGQEYFGGNDSVPIRVTAVTQPIRGDEYDSRGSNGFFSLLNLNTFGGDAPNEAAFKGLQLCFRLRPGVDEKGYADRFLREMKQQLRVGNYWLSGVQPYVQIRTDFLEGSMQASERKLFAILAAFFLVNVFLAVIGTFWFHVVRRRSELGLRMAVGSERNGIMRMMIGEGLLLLTIATLPAFLLFLNLVYLDVFSAAVMEMTVWRFLAVSGIAWTILALVILLAIWYPARKASRLAPADALHCE